MSKFSRRDFLRNVSSTSAALCATQWAGTAATAATTTDAPKKPRRGSDVVTLGKSGLTTTLLGIGTGTRGGSEQRAIGQDGLTKLVRHALDRGIRYIDTADRYRTHVLVQLALEGVPRDKYFIQSKIWTDNPEVAKADLARIRRELNLGRSPIDCVLMHCMMKGTWPVDMRPVLDVLLEAKRKGQIRAVGISNHGFEPLAASLDVEDIDIQLVRINPFGVKAKMDAEPERVSPILKKLHDKGRGILGMKIYGETGLKNREERLESLKYVLGLGTVDAFTIGFTSIAQFDETMDLIEQATT